MRVLRRSSRREETAEEEMTARSTVTCVVMVYTNLMYFIAKLCYLLRLSSSCLLQTMMHIDRLLRPRKLGSFDVP